MGKQTPLSLFAMDDFRSYLRSWAQAKGRGEYRRISSVLGIHTTLTSQILSGRKCLTEEQACGLCIYMGLNSLETDYFLKLVQIERAGSDQLKTVYRRQLKRIRAEGTDVKQRVPEAKELSNQDRALFYSSWQYSFIRLLTSIDVFQTTEAISSRLNLSVSRVQEILHFLTSRGLCEESRGRFHRTEKNTHIEADSPLVVRHHQNWRCKSLALMEQLTADDLAFSAPVSLAKKDFPKIRDLLLETISEAAKQIEKSPAEECAYLGIDWIGM